MSNEAAGKLEVVEEVWSSQKALGWVLQHTNGHEPSCNVNQQDRWDEAQQALSDCENTSEVHGEGEAISIAQAEINIKRNKCTCGYWEGMAQAERALNHSVISHAPAPPQVTSEQVQAAIKKVLGRVLIQGSATEYETKFIADELNAALASLNNNTSLKELTEAHEYLDSLGVWRGHSLMFRIKKALAGEFPLKPPQPVTGDEVREALKHTRSCPQLNPISDEPCTCGLQWRIALQTEVEMHNAWRKRAEEAEAVLRRQGQVAE
jgi:hypothetical protein